MKNFTVFAPMAAIAIALSMQPAIAQAPGGPAIVMKDHSMRASRLIGLPVVNDKGQTIGTIVDVLVKNGAVEPTVVLSVGDFTGESTKMVTAPLSHVKVEKTGIMMPNATKQAVASMPAYKFEGLQGGGG